MEINIELGTWQYNAGVVGFYNILKENDADVRIENDKLIFDSSVLENFEEKYFSYLINKYEKTLSWYKIVEKEDALRKILDDGVENISKKDFEDLNKYITDILKKYVKSASYVSAYEVIESNVNPLEIEKSLKPVAVKKSETILGKKSEIEDAVNKCLKLIEYCKAGKKYLAGKNIVYNLIKNAWNGVSFLNRTKSKSNIYEEMKNYFVFPAINYINEDKSKYKYKCFICESKMKNFKNDFSFLNQTGFDVNRKPSHVWDFKNNIAMCPLCKLIYSCIPAGFNYVYGNGIFINYNRDIKDLIDINEKIYIDIYKKNTEGETSSLTYKALTQSLQEKSNEKMKFELADIQVIRYEEERYYFNILSKKIIDVIINSENELNDISKVWYNEINTTFRIYEEVMKRILNNQNLYTLIHKLLYYKISREKDCHFNSYHIICLLKINSKIMEEIKNDRKI